MCVSTNQLDRFDLGDWFEDTIYRYIGGFLYVLILSYTL